MKCQMGTCKNVAKLKITTSGGNDCVLVCYRDGVRYLRAQIQRMTDYDFGIYVQRAPKEDPKPMNIGRRHKPGQSREEDDEWVTLA